MNPAIFRAYDVRGIYPQDLDEAGAYDIGQAYVRLFKPRRIGIGRDVRLSSPALWKAITDGVTDAGVDVVDLGMISTDMLYFAVANYGYDGGLTVSASHNPREYNGVKMVREKATAISSDTGLFDVRDEAMKAKRTKAPQKGKVSKKDFMTDYLKHVLSFVDPKKIKPCKVVLNGNFGMAGEAALQLLKMIPARIEVVPLNLKPDGSFPKGRPDPMIPENRAETSALVKKEKADFAAAWDADGDRCFFVDENGEFIAGYFITAMLAELLLKKHGPNKIIFDPRLTWATIDTVKKSGGTPLINKAGHTFIKDRMRKEDALFAGEMSGHFYFRDNFYADNGLVPFLLMLELLSVTGTRLSELARPFTSRYFISDEQNFDLGSQDAIRAVIAKIEKTYAAGGSSVEKVDGLTVEFGRDWRFNLRSSNTEPLLRLNVEASSQALLDAKFAELSKSIKAR